MLLAHASRCDAVAAADPATRAAVDALYGGCAAVAAAGAFVRRGEEGLEQSELRVDPADGNHYSRQQFLAFYNGESQWLAAPQAPACTHAQRALARRAALIA